MTIPSSWDINSRMLYFKRLLDLSLAFLSCFPSLALLSIPTPRYCLNCIPTNEGTCSPCTPYLASWISCAMSRSISLKIFLGLRFSCSIWSEIASSCSWISWHFSTYLRLEVGLLSWIMQVDGNVQFDTFNDLSFLKLFVLFGQVLIGQ